MSQHNIIARTNEQQHEYVEQHTKRLIAKVTYHDHLKPKPFRLEFEAWVPGTSISWLADLSRANAIVDEVYENIIQ